MYSKIIKSKKKCSSTVVRSIELHNEYTDIQISNNIKIKLTPVCLSMINIHSLGHGLRPPLNVVEP